ncbi:TIGR02147 family protein [Bdellovibrio sp. HCB209]|uniref:TIGR02147 family protein n=1 Tax=Bdellovibrio sp. HCB209 TaxID=3394354 RepID=UPI0039B3A702
MDSPQVLNYLDINLYLKDFYQYRKSIEEGFSYDAWAAELEMTNRSYLRQMVIGQKKLNQKTISLFAETYFQEPDLKEYFYCLVSYNQTKKSKDRHMFWQKMVEIIRKQARPQEIKTGDNFVSDPLLPRLLTLLVFEDLDRSEESLAKILGKTAEDIRRAIQALQHLELIEPDGQQWRSVVEVFRVPDNKGSLDLIQFHTKSLQEALGAFDLPKETRRYKSVLLPMNDQEFDQFNGAMDEFSKEQMVRHNSKSYEMRRLYQVNFNIYPVSERSE